MSYRPRRVNAPTPKRPHIHDFCVGEKRMQHPFFLFNKSKGLSSDGLFKIFMNHFKEHGCSFLIFAPLLEIVGFLE